MLTHIDQQRGSGEFSFDDYSIEELAENVLFPKMTGAVAQGKIPSEADTGLFVCVRGQ